MFWFIAGMTDAAQLREMGVKFWDQWAVSDESIKAFVEKRFQNAPKGFPAGQEFLDKFKDDIYRAMTDKFLNQIGPMYGAMWRNSPNIQYNPYWPDVPMDQYPSDKMDVWKKDYQEMVGMLEDPSAKDSMVTFEEYCKQNYYSTVDQLNELIRNLKIRPFSSRLVMNTWIPAFTPFEGLPPEENVILGKGALSPCHVMVQCFVSPPKEEGGKNRLSLNMHQRSTDWPVGAVMNQTQYAVLLHLLAHVTDMEPYEFIYDSGDTHAYLNQLPLIEEQLSLTPFPFPKIKINPEVKDLFKIKYEDIEIIGYQSHDKINYPVAK